MESNLNKDKNINPAGQDNSEDTAHKTGLDQWNDRLDENLEEESKGNPLADENAKSYSEQFGSGDQSDELKAPSSPTGPRDGYDNTGTQGYDSLSDDAFTGSSGKENDKDYESRTGSSSEDFTDKKS